MTGELRKYEGTVRIIMPGNSKVSEYPIFVQANDPAEAMQKISEEWKQATEPRDVRVREVAKVMTAS